MDIVQTAASVQILRKDGKESEWHREEIKRTWNLGNACHHSVRNILYSVFYIKTL